MTTALGTDIAQALDVARYLVSRGIPVFAAPPDPSTTTGYALPNGWQQTIPDPAQVDRWQPGWALCAVMGHGLDLVDLDTRNGATPESLNGLTPRTYGQARTPSGGWHLYVKSLGVRSRDNLRPGMDVKAGLPDGAGRGFAFIAPTVKPSKSTGQPAGYSWVQWPDPEGWAAEDTTGAALADAVQAAHAGSNGNGHAPTPGDFMRTGPWVNFADRLSVPGERNRTVLELAASLRGRGGWRFEDALAHMYAVVWPLIDQSEPLPDSEFERTIRSAWNYPDGAEQRSADAVAELAPEQPAGLGVLVGNSAECVEWLKERLGTGALSGVFIRGGWLVHTPRYTDAEYVPLTGEGRNDDGPAQVRRLTASTLASYIQCTHVCYRWTKPTKEQASVQIRAMFPRDAAQVAVDEPFQMPHVRPLRAVIHTPTARADGSVLDISGYDTDTGLLYLPDPDLRMAPVPERPTSADLRNAVGLLDYMVSGFNFATTSDKANYYGLLLTPLLRELAPPPYKLGALDAPQPGSGKTLLATLVRTIHGGVVRVEVPKNPEEWPKAITSILETTTAPVVVWDNVTGVLRSSVLSGLLTSKKWDDRILGESREVHTVNDRLWMITGNNVNLGGDLIRRTLWVRIDPGVPNPERRTDFAIPDLERWTQDHRGELLHALLVLVRAWATAGSPRQRRASDGYAEWVSVVDGILTRAGVPGRFDGEESHHQVEGAEDEEWRDFLRAVGLTFGTGSTAPWTVKALLSRVEGTSITVPVSHLPHAPQEAISAEVLPGDLAEKFAQRGASAVSKSLGNWLRNHKGRWAGGYCVRQLTQRDASNATQWHIDLATKP